MTECCCDRILSGLSPEERKVEQYLTTHPHWLKHVTLFYYIYIIHLIPENITSLWALYLRECWRREHKYANQTSDILRYPVHNKFIMYCAILKPAGTW